MSRAGLLLGALLAVGCGSNQVQLIPPPPEDSGADLRGPPIYPGEEKLSGRGHPDRLPAGLHRATRGDVAVWIDSATASGDQLIVSITIRNRNKEKPVAFTNWTKPEQATLKDDSGKAYPLLPLSLERERTIREWEAKQPKLEQMFGAGPVTHDHMRTAMLEFDRGNGGTEYLDLDLDGEPVGFAEPIYFRIPRNMLMLAVFGKP